MSVSPYKLILLLRFSKASYKSMFWVAQACSAVGVAWMWSRTDRNLLNLCLGATFLLIPETFKFKVLKRDFQLPTIMGVW